MARKIKRGDTVIVISGKSKGLSGKVLKVITKNNRVIVEGANIVKKHVKRGVDGKGRIIEKEAPIHISNVKLICPKCGKPTRVGFTFVDGEKKRFCKKCKQTID
jgi:large subunit ribosomal protein L24